MIQEEAHPADLFGRRYEREILDDFVARARVQGGAMVLAGESGVGKTALAEQVAAAAAASGTTVLWAVGSQFEAQVSFTGLNQALFPLLDDLDTLDAPQGDALRVALGLAAGPPPDRLTLSTAVTLLLRHRAKARPLLLIIDDLQWIDRASAAVLGFAARRLRGSQAALLATYRTGTETFFDRASLPELVLDPLSEKDSALLLRHRFPDLEASVEHRILGTAEGNPLALLELPRALTDAQRAARQPLPHPLPLGRRLQSLFTDRIHRLPPRTRSLLLIAALEGTGNLSVLLAAAAGGVEDLAPAEQDELVTVTSLSGRLVFRHPLIRAAAVEVATTDDLRHAHRALAWALADDLERRAWHLGQASVGPDEEVAGLLRAAAHRVLGRGDAQEAVEMLCRAADLSTSPAERDRRLSEAAWVGAEYLGQTQNAVALLDGIRQSSPAPPSSLHYAAAAALVMLDAGTPIDTAHQLLVNALDSSARLGEQDTTARVNALWALGVVCFAGGRPDLWPPFDHGVDDLGDDAPEDLLLARALFIDPVARGAAALPDLDAALATVHESTDPNNVENLAACAFYLDRLAWVREPLWRTVQQGRSDGASRRHLVALMDLCVEDFHRGAWKEAGDLAAEGLEVCERLGGSFFAYYMHYHQALLAAVQGEAARCRTVADQMISWGGPRGVGLAQVFARHALVLNALGESDWETAYQQASAISPAGVFVSHLPHSMWVAMDLVDAAVRTGRHEQAALHVEAIRAAGIAELSPRLAILAAAAQAMIADDEGAPELFERALGLPTVHEWPFDAARIRLVYGERLRRARATTASRTHLQQALTAFDELGARPWAQRAERELRAAGQAVHGDGPTRAVASLTAQELQIARMAAAGLTNKEIGEQLYLSPRTVSGHLYRVFPKLGITKRAALRDALGHDEQ
ncbi:LuxR family transcriptional regulator [Actinocorallia aurea]